MPLQREIILAPEAELELAAILDFIAAQNAFAAGAMSAKFDELFRGIAIAPRSGTPSPRDKSVRRRIVTSYVVYYTLDEANDHILILAIIHGARIKHRMRNK